MPVLSQHSHQVLSFITDFYSPAQETIDTMWFGRDKPLRLLPTSKLASQDVWYMLLQMKSDSAGTIQETWALAFMWRSWWIWIIFWSNMRGWSWFSGVCFVMYGLVLLGAQVCSVLEETVMIWGRIIGNCDTRQKECARGHFDLYLLLKLTWIKWHYSFLFKQLGTFITLLESNLIMLSAMLLINY